MEDKRKTKPRFRLRFLLSPAYMASALREIGSARDFFFRLWNVFRYIGFELKAKAGIRLNGKYYSLVPAARGLVTRLGKPLRAFRDARSDALLPDTVSGYRPRKRPLVVKNPPSPLVPGTELFPRISWNIHLSCNYDCPYCWFHGGWTEYIGKAVALSAPEWRVHWDRFNDRHGPAHIEVAGGEPFTYPDFTGILAMLAARNTVSVSTNFAWDPSGLIGRADPSRVCFSCSFHPEFARSADLFAEKILRLRETGFHATASVVAYPPYLPLLAEWNDSFFSRGIHLTVQPFRGFWKGAYYPAAYTEKAKRVLAWFITGEYLKLYPAEITGAAMGNNSALDHDKPGMMTGYQMDLKGTFGRLCNSGRLYGRLQYNGDLQRCSQGGYVGNFLSEDFRMYSEAKPCPFATCECSNELLYVKGGPLGPGAASAASPG